MTNKTWSPGALMVCEFCGLLWICIVFGACTYIVFWLNQSGWWYLLAMIIASGWTCERFHSPEQIAASALAEKDDD